MAHNIDHLHRRSIRLVGYDYSHAGAYFVTVCTHDRACLFGDVVNGLMVLNDAGMIVKTSWDEIPAFYPGIDIDAFVVMPNHVHGVIIITHKDNSVGATPCGCPNDDRGCPPPDRGCIQLDDGRVMHNDGQPAHNDGQPPVVAPTAAPHDDGQPQGVAPTIDIGRRLSLPDVVHRFKTITTKRYSDGVKCMDWLPYEGRLWQRNYYEHIIRSEKSLNHIRQYIADNPKQWAADRDNMNAVTPEPRNIWRN